MILTSAGRGKATYELTRGRLVLTGCIKGVVFCHHVTFNISMENMPAMQLNVSQENSAKTNNRTGQINKILNHINLWRFQRGV